MNKSRSRLLFTNILFFLVLLTPLAVAAKESFDLGIAITPRNFPKHGPDDVDDAFKLAKSLAKYSVFIFQWKEFNPATVKLMMDKSRQQGLIPILGLSPTSLDKGRKELDIPDKIRKRAGRMISFANPVIQKAFVESAKDLARLKPAFLCLATEINFLALQRIDEYLHFVSLYKKAYKAVKAVSPATQVFVSFQWEWVRILDSKEMHKIKEHSKLIRIFKPQLDLVALTSYPSAFHDSPRQLPRDYYSWVYKHIDQKDTVMFMEMGWPSTGTGSEREQQIFMKRLPTLLKPVKTSIVAWALLHDVNLKEFDANLNSVGILTTGGRKKPAFDVFRELR